MEQIILIVHVLTALAIIGLILIQQGKGSDMGASFGAGGSQTVFGSQGSGNVLTKGTAILATVFFVTSFGLAIVAKDKAVSAGLVDMPTPAVVESKDMPAIPESDSEIPTAVPAISDMPATGDDIPALGSSDSAAPAETRQAKDREVPAVPES